MGTPRGNCCDASKSIDSSKTVFFKLAKQIMQHHKAYYISIVNLLCFHYKRWLGELEFRKELESFLYKVNNVWIYVTEKVHLQLLLNVPWLPAAYGKFCLKLSSELFIQVILSPLFWGKVLCCLEPCCSFLLFTASL